MPEEKKARIPVAGGRLPKQISNNGALTVADGLDILVVLQDVTPQRLSRLVYHVLHPTSCVFCARREPGIPLQLNGKSKATS